jgi:hypothetical protein
MLITPTSLPILCHLLYRPKVDLERIRRAMLIDNIGQCLQQTDDEDIAALIYKTLQQCSGDLVLEKARLHGSLFQLT